MIQYLSELTRHYNRDFQKCENEYCFICRNKYISQFDGYNNIVMKEFKKKRPNIELLKLIIDCNNFENFISYAGNYIAEIFEPYPNERVGVRKSSLKKISVLIYAYEKHNMDIPNDLQEMYINFTELENKKKIIKTLYSSNIPSYICYNIKKYL